MNVSGAHILLFSRDAEADRKFFHEVLEFRSVDAGHGWLIFKLPPAEAAVHPAGEQTGAELYLMCDDLRALVQSLAAREVACTSIEETPWGLRTNIRLPGGGQLGLYQPRHPVALHL